MPTIFDLLYREYCRVRLTEMRKQLLLKPGSHEIPEAGSHLDGATGRDSSFGDDRAGIQHEAHRY